MTAELDNQPGQQSPSSKAPLIVTSVFGLLYLLFIVDYFIAAYGGDATVPYEASFLEQILFALMFMLFLMGYLVVRKNELIGGTLFVLWWVAMWGMEIFVFAPKGGDTGSAVGMGFPLFVLGILFIRRWYKGRSA